MTKLFVPKVLALLISVICFSGLEAQTFKLLKDINALTHSNPANATLTTNAYAILNGKAYFSADDGVHGKELWCSDGTAAGTTMVKDLQPGEGSSNIGSIFVYKNKLYFFTSLIIPNAYKSTLYSSDGTAAGTVMLKDSFGLTAFETNPTSFIVMNDILYFSAASDFSYDELWRTDGTVAGTKMVINFSTPEHEYKSMLQNLTLFNNKLFFSVGPFPGQLWYTDGTEEGTKKFTWFGNGISQVNKLAVLGNSLYMLANNSLWVTNGDSLGSKRATNPGVFSVSGIQSFKNNLYVSARNSSSAYGLYTYNPPSPGGLSLFKQFSAAPVFAPALQDSLLFFTATKNPASPPGLWVTDGTPANTALLVNDKQAFTNFYTAGNLLYFSHTGGAKGEEPWISDGTVAGTRILEDVNSGVYSSLPAHFTQLGNYVLFAANTNDRGLELYKTDISSTTLVKDINTTTTAISFPSINNNQYDTINNQLLFWVNDGIHGFEPWATDGTNGGTTLLKDIVPGFLSSNGSFIYSFNSYGGYIQTPVNNRINGYDYFFAVSPSNVWALYKTQGTPGTTTLATALPTIAKDMRPTAIAAVNNKIFAIVSIADSSQLYVYDGATEPMLLKTGFTAATSLDFGKGILGDGHNLYFFVDHRPEIELWKTDGTVGGTMAVKNLYPGQTYGYSAYMTNYKGAVYFLAGTDNFKWYLWKTDGTSAGTTIVKNMEAVLGPIKVSNNKLYFTGHEDATGNEAWVTDGTAAGTHIVKDIEPGNNTYNTFNFIDYKGEMYLSLNNGNTQGFWKTNGTDTIRIAKNGNYFINGGDKLYYIADNKIWQTDSSAGSNKMLDTTSISGLVPYALIYANGRLYFQADTYQYGMELYTTSEKLLPITLLNFSGSLKGNDALLNWQTANELHNDYFNVQRSTTGGGFTTIGRVQAKNGTDNNYNFADAGVITLGVDKLYYRLQQVDLDGKNEYSKTIQLAVVKGSLLKVWPNPAANFTKVYSSINMPGALVQLVDATGHTVYTGRHSIPAGGSVTIPLQGYAKGVYTVTVQQQGMQKQEYKVVVE